MYAYNLHTCILVYVKNSRFVYISLPYIYVQFVHVDAPTDYYILTFILAHNCSLQFSTVSDSHVTQQNSLFRLIAYNRRNYRRHIA